MNRERREHPKPTPNAAAEVDRALLRLRAIMKQQGFSQLRVQEALGWGRSYVSQLLTRQKSLRYHQILQILEVVGVEPLVFFSGLFGSLDRHQAQGAVVAAVEQVLQNLLRQDPPLLAGGLGGFSRDQLYDALVKKLTRYVEVHRGNVR